MTNPFASPATASGVDLKALNGSLLIIEVHSLEHEITTAYGKSDAIRCDVAVLDGSNKGEQYKDTLLFPKVLQSQLRSNIGGKVIGRLGQGQQKPGQSPPWLLSEASAADIEAGKAWLAGNSLTSASTAGTPPF